MMRLLGGVMILFACVYGGLRAGAGLRHRVKLLRGLQQGLLLLEQEMACDRSMEQAFRGAAAGAGTADFIFLSAADRLHSDATLSAGEAWCIALQEEPALGDAAEILSLIAEGLGSVDRKAQARSLELCRTRLYGAEQQAAEDAARWGKLWHTLGWSLGVLLILVAL